MILDIFNWHPVLRILDQKILNKISGGPTDVRRYLVAACYNLFIQSLSVSVTKRKIPADHNKKNDSAAPQISLFRIVPTFAFNNFRGSIARWPAKRFQLFGFVLVTETKINNFKLTIIVDKYVLRFKIPVSYFVFV